jgi:hypothetical protein
MKAYVTRNDCCSRLPVPDRKLLGVSHPYNNQALVGVGTGSQIQIDELARGNPNGLDEHRTGAVYGISIGPNPGHHRVRRKGSNRRGTILVATFKIISDNCNEQARARSFRQTLPLAWLVAKLADVRPKLLLLLLFRPNSIHSTGQIRPIQSG